MFENESMDVTRKLLIALGLEIKSDNNSLIDQETKNQIFLDGKIVKANINPDKALYVDADHDIRLDPLDPKCTKIIDRLLGKYLDDGEETGDLPHTLTMFLDFEKETKKSRLTIKFENGNTWIGNWYNNRIMCYDEAIFSLDGTFADIDLRPYDIIYSELEDN